MANSKYEYVKSFEVVDKLLPNTWIVVRIDGRNFHRFSDENEFNKPNDVQALNLMNSCAVAMLEEFTDIIFSYGVSDEYSFIFKRTSQFYERRASKILSTTVSLFTANYVKKWKEFFPQKEMRLTPSFDGRVVCYPSNVNLRDYLAWRQVDCHINNQYNTCFWMLVLNKDKTKKEAQDILKGTQTQDKNELLFQQFNINYSNLPAIFRKGSCVFKDKVEEIVKHTERGDPVKRLRKKVVVSHCDVIGDRFWKDHPWILDE
ncbi:tRNA(His) guanylyltransferase [Thalictrum thalictroides]|uniref:tRNA(His) guanylyltransferase n=1 Tax=Thalictrum thalictroides TaxID=46969 RepID=A0A7J6V3H2_THATH|nr:tRNA(His) guanylyltransferase [Thalictrum thalictroides]